MSNQLAELHLTLAGMSSVLEHKVVVRHVINPVYWNRPVGAVIIKKSMLNKLSNITGAEAHPIDGYVTLNTKGGEKYDFFQYTDKKWYVSTHEPDPNKWGDDLIPGQPTQEAALLAFDKHLSAHAALAEGTRQDAARKLVVSPNKLAERNLKATLQKLDRPVSKMNRVGLKNHRASTTQALADITAGRVRSSGTDHKRLRARLQEINTALQERDGNLPDTGIRSDKELNIVPIKTWSDDELRFRYDGALGVAASSGSDKQAVIKAKRELTKYRKEAGRRKIPLTVTVPEVPTQVVDSDEVFREQHGKTIVKFNLKMSAFSRTSTATRNKPTQANIARQQTAWDALREVQDASQQEVNGRKKAQWTAFYQKGAADPEKTTRIPHVELNKDEQVIFDSVIGNDELLNSVAHSTAFIRLQEDFPLFGGMSGDQKRAAMIKATSYGMTATQQEHTHTFLGNAYGIDRVSLADKTVGDIEPEDFVDVSMFPSNVKIGNSPESDWARVTAITSDKGNKQITFVTFNNATGDYDPPRTYSFADSMPVSVRRKPVGTVRISMDRSRREELVREKTRDAAAKVREAEIRKRKAEELQVIKSIIDIDKIKSPAMRGRIYAHLKKSVKYNGVYMSNRQLYALDKWVSKSVWKVTNSRGTDVSAPYIEDKDGVGIKVPRMIYDIIKLPTSEG